MKATNTLSNHRTPSVPPPQRITFQSLQLDIKLKRAEHSHGKSRGKTHSPVPHSEEKNNGQRIAPSHAEAKPQPKPAYGTEPLPMRKPRKKQAAPKAGADETDADVQFVERGRKRRQKSKEHRADKAEEGTEVQHGIAQGQPGEEEKVRRPLNHKDNKRGGGLDADAKTAATMENAKVHDAGPGKVEEQPIQKAVEAEAVAETEEKPAKHHRANRSKRNMAENDVFPTRETNTIPAAASSAWENSEAPKVEPFFEVFKPEGEDHNADVISEHFAQPEPATKQLPTAELRQDAIRSVPPETLNVKSALKLAGSPEDKKYIFAQPEATVPDDKKEEAERVDKIVENVVVSSAAPPSPAAVMGKSADDGVSVPPAAQTVLLVSPVEEIKQYTPTLTDLTPNNDETAKTGAPAPIEEEGQPESARKNEDTEYESGSWSSENPDEKPQPPTPVQDTQPTCRTVDKLAPEVTKPPESILCSKLMLALMVSNLVMVLALVCFVAYSVVNLKGAGSRMRDVRASGPRRILETKNASASVVQMFNATDSDVNSTMSSWGSLWNIGGFENTMAQYESADTYTLAATKVDTEMSVLPTLIGNYANTIDALASSINGRLTLVPNMLYLVGYNSAHLSSIDSTVKSTSSAFSTFSTTMQTYLSNILPRTYYMSKFLSLTTCIFYSKSLTYAMPTKKVAIISADSANVYLPKLIDSSLFPNTIFDPLIYTTDTATGWQYSLPQYSAVMFDFYDGYTSAFSTTAQESLVAFMNRGGNVMFPYGTLTRLSTTWDSALYTYCGIDITTGTNTVYTTHADLNAANACHQIIAYPNDLTKKSWLLVSPTYSEPWAATNAKQLYGFNNFIDTYLTAITNGAQKCVVTDAGYSYTFTADEKALFNNVGYWMLYNHYGGN